MSNLAVGGIIPKGIAYRGVGLAGIAKDGSVVWTKDVSKTYYACYTDNGIGYYTDVIPEIGDTGLNMYNSEFDLIATDGAVTAFTLSGTTYPLITSDDLNLVVVRWNDNNDVTV